MKVLVTGGGGFLGASLIRRLRQEGYSVRALLRRKESAFNLDGVELEVFIGNVLDKDCLARAMVGVDYVFHTAAVFRGYPFYIRHPEEIFQTNIEGTRNLCEAALAAGIRRVVYTSSAAAVGMREDGMPADETVPLNLLDRRSFYERSKAESEKVALSYHALGLNIVSVNPSFLFGVGDSRPTPTGEMIVKFLNRSYPCYFDALLCVSDIDSTVEAHFKALSTGESGQRYIVAHGRHYTLAEIFKMLEEISGVRAPFLKLPLNVVHIFSLLNEAILGLLGLGGKVGPVIDSETVRYFSLGARYDGSQGQRVLGLTFKDFREVLSEEVAWYMRHGYVRRSSKIGYYRKIGKLKT
ncbi:MAG: NAD-dependent epimerase/dehydratase family protein [Candidatus Omnitrophica bacterium]|nr:NAD-dependent epimerase/dehydratase family protein [Candidatus Omnitrophota bacterium]